MEQISPLLLTLIGTAIAFIITSLGSASVFFVKSLSKKTVAILYSFSAGVMLASSIFSLLLPSLDYADQLGLHRVIIPVSVLVGILVLVLSDLLIRKKFNRFGSGKRKSILLVSAITIHNIPEGMCIGVAFAGIAMGNTFMGALMLAIAIAIQDFPEGAAVAFPLYAEGKSKFRSFLWGSFSGFIELIFGITACLIASFITYLLPVMLALSAGMMIIVTLIELMPEITMENKMLSTVGFSVGFLIMMLLDTLLG